MAPLLGQHAAGVRLGENGEGGAGSGNSGGTCGVRGRGTAVARGGCPLGRTCPAMSCCVGFLSPEFRLLLFNLGIVLLHVQVVGCSSQANIYLADVIALAARVCNSIHYLVLATFQREQ